MISGCVSGRARGWAPGRRRACVYLAAGARACVDCSLRATTLARGGATGATAAVAAPARAWTVYMYNL